MSNCGRWTAVVLVTVCDGDPSNGVSMATVCTADTLTWWHTHTPATRGAPGPISLFPGSPGPP